MSLIDLASWFCLVTGAVFCMIGAVGMLRLPDLYTRTHAATITDTLGASLVLIGLALQAGPGLTALKLLMVLAFLLYTSPVGGHALVAAAYAGGLKADLDVPFDNSEPGPDVPNADDTTATGANSDGPASGGKEGGGGLPD